MEGRSQQLDQLDTSWIKSKHHKHWYTNYKLLKDTYYDPGSNVLGPVIVKNHKALSKWVAVQKNSCRIRSNNPVIAAKHGMLVAINFNFNVKKRDPFDDNIEMLRNCKANGINEKSTEKLMKLNKWVQRQRTKMKARMSSSSRPLSLEHFGKLCELNISWHGFDAIETTVSNSDGEKMQFRWFMGDADRDENSSGPYNGSFTDVGQAESRSPPRQPTLNINNSSDLHNNNDAQSSQTENETQLLKLPEIVAALQSEVATQCRRLDHSITSTVHSMLQDVIITLRRD